MKYFYTELQKRGICLQHYYKHYYKLPDYLSKQDNQKINS